MAAFRSGIFNSAIFWSCSRVILPTLVLLGTPEPDSRLMAFLMRTAAGGAKSTVCVYGDHNGDNEADIVLGALIKFLGESHNVYAVLTQCGTNGGRGGCLAGRDLQLDIAYYFLSHVSAPPNMW